jgi:glycerophosphoryl diester phosphodiesterase
MEFNGKLDREKVLQTAISVGIDVAQLEKDMEDPKLKQIIDRNMALAAALGVRGFSDGSANISAEFVSHSHARLFSVVAWTVDDVPTWASLAQMGVDGIMSTVLSCGSRRSRRPSMRPSRRLASPLCSATAV